MTFTTKIARAARLALMMLCALAGCTDRRTSSEAKADHPPDSARQFIRAAEQSTPTVTAKTLYRDSLYGSWTTDGINSSLIIWPEGLQFEGDTTIRSYRLSHDTLIISEPGKRDVRMWLPKAVRDTLVIENPETRGYTLHVRRSSINPRSAFQ